MLSAARAVAGARTEDEHIAMRDDEWFSSLRSREFSRLERLGLTYVDYTGAPPFPASLIAADGERLRDAALGNPHSRSGPAQRATQDIEAARRAILEFLHADPAEYAVVLTANASAACRLVAESFPFGPGSILALTADNHNSVVGIREHAGARGATVRVIPLDDALRLAGNDTPGASGRTFADVVAATRPTAPSLFAFPAQSNFSGVRHPLSMVAEAQRAGWRVLLDAAAYLPTADLDLREVRPDFVCLSLYKISGYPTGVGALVARHEALAELVRPAFAGGTVRWVSVEQSRHLMAVGPERFEDGTPNFLAAGAIPLALDAARAAGRERLPGHLRSLAGALLAGMRSARHPNGAPRVRLHGPADTDSRGATVAFTILDARGQAVPYWDIEDSARVAGIALRGGCFCNPGCSERAFRFADRPMAQCLDELGEAFTIPAFAECFGDREVGAVRVSFGLGSVMRDVERVLGFIGA